MRAFVVAKQLQNFEKQLRTLSLTTDESEAEVLTLHELQVRMRAYHGNLSSVVLGYTLSLDFEVQINNWQYFVALDELVKQTHAQFDANYIMYKFLYYLIADGVNDFTKIECMWEVRTQMDLGVNFLYKHEEQMHIYSKTTRMRINIGNLPADVSETFIDKHYADVHMTTNDYHKNHMQLLKLRASKEDEMLTRDRSQPNSYILAMVIRRVAVRHIIVSPKLVVIPFAFLQTPIFHHNMHDILKMGSFGLCSRMRLCTASMEMVYSSICSQSSGSGDSIAENEHFESSLKCLQQTETER
ncbi:unnamed protein product [Ceratitis capitata]|uniref:(Mediterranean fruit fly) hypothetical protein n=1 Tax=Ceratitis capitata TaxID=7213 RepID=A0A811UI10_CERCA|nr:unnamed protein product [Ceratitis capitata]